jgi:serine/threonine-protein kinase
MPSLPTHPALLTEEQLPREFGRYTLLAILGEGAMGRVFRAELQGPAGFRKATAVKVMRKAADGDDDEFRRAIVKEARIGALLRHPNIVETYDFGETDGTPFISMELVDGLGVDRLLRAFGRLPPDLALDCAIQVCQGLDFAHRLQDRGRPAKLIHRDIKPSNVIVGRDGRARLMDFGIAKAAVVSGVTTASGHTRGTPSYMSPEQARGMELDGRSDLFALATVIYEMLTGKVLFHAPTMVSTMMAIVAADATLAKEALWEPLRAALPGLEPVLKRCLRADREQRYASAGELGAALSGVLAGVPAAASWAATVAGFLGEPRGEFPAAPGSEDVTLPGTTEQSPSALPPTEPRRSPLPVSPPQSAGGGAAPLPPASVAPAAPRPTPAAAPRGTREVLRPPALAASPASAAQAPAASRPSAVPPPAPASPSWLLPAIVALALVAVAALWMGLRGA